MDFEGCGECHCAATIIRTEDGVAVEVVGSITIFFRAGAGAHIDEGRIGRDTNGDGSPAAFDHGKERCLIEPAEADSSCHRGGDHGGDG